MISMFKIVGDLFGAYVVHMAGAALAVVLASEAYGVLAHAAAPIAHALG